MDSKDKVEIRDAMRSYLRLPIYMLLPIAIVGVGMGIYDRKLIWPMVGILVVYGIVAIVAYIRLRQRCVSSLINLAVSIETSQKEFLENIQMPYCILDGQGRVIWHNRSFAALSDIEENKNPTITSILPGIDLHCITKMEGECHRCVITHKDRIFRTEIEKISEGGVDNKDEAIFAMILFDETKIVELENRFDAEKLVVANVIIDNYEETLEGFDDAKNSLLVAVIERKIRKYFGEADAIIRKLEKDKFFLIFPKKFLYKLIEDKFSILEDIKNTKVGGETQLTLSIGMGLNGDSYARDADYAKTAINLALGRGGSQVVVKDAGDVTIYGAKGKEVSKNARVKARVKAQALREIISNRDRVIVMGHKISDYDCLGAAVGISAAAKYLGKPCHIVIDNVTKSLRPMMETFLNDEDYEPGWFVNTPEAMELVDKHTLVVVVDTNKPGMLECPDLLEKTKDIVVFDHHRQGKEIIEAPLLSYIEPYASSTCEMIAEILQYFSESIHLSPKEADALYAGMLIDTNNFMTKTGVRTFEAAAFLRRSGAEVTRVRKLLREDIFAYKTRAEIVRNARVYKDSFAISTCISPEIESPTVAGAQAANELLNIVGIKASFVLTEFDGKIYVSSRSIDEIDVQYIMEKLGGGGHLNVAGAQVEGKSVEEVIREIQDIIDSMMEEGLIK